MSKTHLPTCTLTVKETIDSSVFVAPGAQIVGDVTLMQEASVWYNAVLRGDINKIVVGKRSNIQDGCVLHLENDRPCIIGDDVTVGHKAILHGCTIESGCLIGMGAIVLNGAVIKKGSVVAAGAVVKENMVVEPFSLVAGIPAKFVKELPPSTYDTHLLWAAKYVGLSHLHAQYQKSKSSS